MFETLSDFANLPLLVLVSTVLSFLLMPALNAYSRFNERQADRYAFQSIRSVQPFISFDEQTGRAESGGAHACPAGWSGFSIRIPRFPGGSPRPKPGSFVSQPIAAVDASPPLRQHKQSPLASRQQALHAMQVLFRIHPNGVERRLSHVNRDSVFKKTQLFQPLRLFQRRFGQRDETIQRRLAVRIEIRDA